MTVIGVIRRTPDPEMDDGNLAAALVYGDLTAEQRLATLLVGRTQVFELGEILILEGEGEREVGGRGRKPSKWDVDVEYFDTLDEAVECSRATTHDGFLASLEKATKATEDI